MFRNYSIVALAAILAVAIVREIPAQSSSQRYDRAKSVGSAANARASVERAEAANAQGVVATAAGHIRLLEQHLDELTTSLAQFEDDIIESHPEDSRLRVAIADAKRAEQAYVEIQRNVLESPAYKSAYAAAKASPNKAEMLPRVRQEFLDRDPAARDAAAERTSTRKRLDIARQEVLRQDEGWVELAAEVKSVKEELSLAKRVLERGQLADAAASSAYRRAAAIAAKAAAITSRFEAVKKANSSGKKKGSRRR